MSVVVNPSAARVIGSDFSRTRALLAVATAVEKRVSGHLGPRSLPHSRRETRVPQPPVLNLGVLRCTDTCELGPVERAPAPYRCPGAQVSARTAARFPLV